eukprot:g28560.t1
MWVLLPIWWSLGALAQPINIKLGGLLPHTVLEMDGTHEALVGPALTVAVQQVNSDAQYNTFVTVSPVTAETQCEGAEALAQYLTMPSHDVLVGPVCLDSCVYVRAAANSSGSATLAVGCQQLPPPSPATPLYSNFMRMNDPLNKLGEALVAVTRHFGWTHISILATMGYEAQATQIEKTLRKKGIYVDNLLVLPLESSVELPQPHTNPRSVATALGTLHSARSRVLLTLAQDGNLRSLLSASALDPKEWTILFFSETEASFMQRENTYFANSSLEDISDTEMMVRARGLLMLEVDYDRSEQFEQQVQAAGPARRRLAQNALPVSSIAYYLADTVQALANATRLYQQNSSASSYSRAGVEQYLLNRPLSGLTGDFMLLQEQLPSGRSVARVNNLRLRNYFNRDWRTVAVLDFGLDDAGDVEYNYSAVGQVVWADGSTDVPSDLLEDREILVGALFNLDTELGLSQLIACQAAVDSVNADKLNFPALHDERSGAALRLVYKNTKGDPLRAREGAIALVYEGVAGLIGPDSDNVADGVAQISTASGLPLITGVVQRPKLTRWKYVGRTVPNAADGGRASMSFVDHFFWSNVVVVYSTDEYGLSSIAELNQAAQEKNINVEWQLPVDPLNIQASIKQIILNLKKNIKTRVIIVFCQEDIGIPLLRATIGIQNIIFVLGDKLRGLPFLDQAMAKHLQGMLLIDYYLRRNDKRINLDKLLCSAPFVINNTCPDKNVTDSAAYSTDAVTALAHMYELRLRELGLQSGLYKADMVSLQHDAVTELPMDRANCQPGCLDCGDCQKCSSDCNYCPAGMGFWQGADSLFASIGRVEFAGVTGQVNFLSDGDRLSTVVLRYLSCVRGPGNACLEPTWAAALTAQSGIVQSTLGASNTQVDIVWPGYLLETPVDIEIVRSHYQVLIGLNPPFLIENVGATGKVSYTGYLVDLLDILARNLQFTYNITAVPFDEGRTTTALEAFDNSSSQNFLITQKATTSEIYTEYDISRPYYFSGIQVAVLQSTTDLLSLETFGLLAQPLSKAVWGLTGATCVVFAGVMWVIEHRKNVDQWPKEFSIMAVSESLWYSLSTFLGTPDKSPITMTGRIVAIIFYFFAFALLSAYTANLAAFLTLANINTVLPSITTLSGKVLTICNSDVEAYLLATQESYSFTLECVNTVDEALNAVRTELYTGFVYTDEIIKYETARKENCMFLTGKDVVEPKDYGFIFRAGALSTSVFSKELLRLNEEGTLLQLQYRWWVQLGECTQTKNTAVTQVNYYNLLGIFALMLASSVFAFVMLSAETVYLWCKFVVLWCRQRSSYSQKPDTKQIWKEVQSQRREVKPIKRYFYGGAADRLRQKKLAELEREREVDARGVHKDDMITKEQAADFPFLE